MPTERQRLEVAESVSQEQPQGQGLLAKFLEIFDSKPGPPDFGDDYPNGFLLLIIWALFLLLAELGTKLL